ncbi:MAG: cyclic lactone autoinducer peptide [Treponema sp.]|nr:cyclic lactone autoinducer peptide [Treponema sp.]
MNCYHSDCFSDSAVCNACRIYLYQPETGSGFFRSFCDRPAGSA